MSATIAAQGAVSAEDIPMKRPHRKNFFQWVPTDDAQLRDAEGRMMRSLRNRYAQHVCAGLNTFSLLLAPEAALYIRRMSETLAASGGAAATATAHEVIASYLFGGSHASTATASGAEQQPVTLASSARLKVRHLVFIHGFGAGAPLWLPQLRYFAELADGHNTHVLRKLAEGLASSAASGAPSSARPAAPESTATLLFVHAIDLPGFARSRRDVEEFADAEHVRAYMVEGLRQWVDAMALDSPARWCSLGVTLHTSTMPPSVQAVAAPDAALDAFITNRAGAVAALAELLLPQQQAKKKKAALHQPPPTAEAIAAVTTAAGPQRVETATRAQWELVLAGHSFGGFLCGHFAAAHPDLVHHLILCDPWGVPHSDDPFENVKRLPFLIRKAAGLFMNGTLNPLSILRGLGPLGPTVIPKVRRDFGIRWRPLLTPSTERETRGLGRLGASPLSWHDRREQERQIQHRHRTEHGQQVNVMFPEALRWPHADDVIAAGLLGFSVDPAEAADTLHANVTAALLTFAARQQAAFLFEESTIEAFEAACGERAYRLQEHAYVQRKLEKRRAEVEKEQRCRKSSSRGCFGDDDVAVGGAGKSAGAFSPVGSLDGSTAAGAAAAGTPASPVAPVTTDAPANGSVKSSAPSSQGADGAEDSTDVDPWTQIFYDYIFHANARLPATGEAAMKMSNVGTGFARLPLQKTVPGALAHSKIHVTAIYGRQTWMAPGCGRDLLEELRAQRVSALKASLEKQLEQDEAAPAVAGSIQAPPSHAQVDLEEPAPAGADADSAIPAAEAVRPKWAPKRVPMTGAQLTGKAPGVLFPATSDGRIPAAMFTQQDDGCIYDFAFVPRAGHQLNTDNPGDFNALMHRALRME